MAQPSQPNPQAEAEYPLAAQIPLPSFTLPDFPEQASHLRSLTLTSDINLNDYQSKHLAAGTFEPSTTLPSSISHLTLELFSLGFPAPFLTGLSKSLPNLQSLTLFSCLIDGIDERSRHDAVAFFTSAAKSLKELHVVDTYARAGFWNEVSKALHATGSLVIVEVSYTYRGHHESDFLNRVGGDEWVEIITPSLIGLSLNFVPPPQEIEETKMQTENAEDAELVKAQDGILPYASDGRASVALRRKIELMSGHKKGGDALNLKVLNLSLFSLRPVEVGEVVYAVAAGDGSGGLVSLTVSVLLEDGWLETLLEGLEHKGAGSALESIEIVGVPTSTGGEVTGAKAEELLIRDAGKIESLGKICQRLETFEMTILQSRTIANVAWKKENGNWKRK